MEKLNVLEQNFQMHHFVSPEVSAAPFTTHILPPQGTRAVRVNDLLFRPVQLRAKLAIELDLPEQKVRATIAQHVRCLITRSDTLHIAICY